MLRLDMSEFHDKYTVSRLIGAPPGYVGYEEGGQLTEPVRRRPYSVILFDEVEKAHPDVYNVLLQVLDDGRLTDGQGRTVSFKNTILILTSNIGSQHIQAIEDRDLPSEDKRELIERAVMDDVRKTMRPEFLNRLDEMVVFHRLEREQMHKIIDIQLARFAERLAKRDISIELRAGGEGLPRRGRLGSAVRRAAAEARDAALPRGPAREARHRRRLPARHAPPRRPRARRASRSRRRCRTDQGALARRRDRRRGLVRCGCRGPSSRSRARRHRSCAVPPKRAAR